MSSCVSSNEVVRLDSSAAENKSNTPSSPLPSLQVKRGKAATSAAKKAVPTGGARIKFGANVATLKPASCVAKKTGTKRVGAAASAPPAKKKRMIKFAMSSKEDVGDQLLTAASGGGGDRKDKFLRAVFRRAVELEYDQAVAHSRVAAALGGRYTMVDTANALGSGEPVEMVVTFAKGMGSRLMLEDKVDFLSLDKLKAVVQFISSGMQAANTAVDSEEAADSVIDSETRDYNMNMLKPAAMAGCSPRVFWSLVRHFGGDVIRGLALLIPEQDWNWLSERPRRLSEKAAANLEMKREQELERDRKKIKKSQNDTPEPLHDETPTDPVVAVTTSPGRTTNAPKVDEWAAHFTTRLNAPRAMIPLLSRIFHLSPERFNCLSNDVPGDILSPCDQKIYETIYLRLFPEDSCDESVGGSSVLHWANSESVVEAHLTWSSWHHSRSRHLMGLSTASSKAGEVFNPNILCRALTVWDFYDIVYGARALVMRELWADFCSDVFGHPGMSSSTAEWYTFCRVVTMLALSIDTQKLASAPSGSTKRVRPRDIATWRLSPETFRSRLLYFFELCVSLPENFEFKQYTVSNEDIVKLACDKLHFIRSSYCEWIDSENWALFEGSICKDDELATEPEVPPAAVSLTCTSLNESITLTVFISAACRSEVDNQYADMLSDLEELTADDWVTDCPRSLQTKAAMTARAKGEVFSPSPEQSDGSHFIGEVVSRTFDDSGTKSTDRAIVIAFAPVLDADGDNVPLWKVQYADGDREDLEEHEILRALSDTIA